MGRCRVPWCIWVQKWCKTIWILDPSCSYPHIFIDQLLLTELQKFNGKDWDIFRGYPDSAWVNRTGVQMLAACLSKFPLCLLCSLSGFNGSNLKIYVHVSEPVHMTLFEKGGFADVRFMWGDYPDYLGGTKSNDKCPYKRRIQERRRWPCEGRGRLGVMQPQAKECRQPPKVGRGKTWIFL